LRQLALILAASLWCAAPVPARAATLVVTRNADSGPGTLRQALAAARAGDRVAFDLAAGESTIALAHALPPPPPGVTLDLANTRATVRIAGASWPLARGAGLELSLAPGRSAVLDSAVIGAAGDRGLSLAGGGTLVLERQNSWRGGTIVTAGTLRLEGNGQLPSDGMLTLEGGRVELSAGDARVGGLSGRGGVVAIGSHSLTVSQERDTEFAGAISGPGRLIKDGPGRLVLAAPQGWTGGTVLTGGMLQLAGEGPAVHLHGPIMVQGGTLIAPGLRMGAGRP
jgi:fibronectin-binding autotransporter adhesin